MTPPRTRTSTRSQQLSAQLSSAMLEWVLIILLLLEGIISYLGAAFARRCKLPPPCPACTRLGHVAGKARRGFYGNLMCRSHKEEASSWAFCHIHHNLVDGHTMCEPCLLSFATQDKSSPRRPNRQFAAKLGVRTGDAGFGHGLSSSAASEAPAMGGEGDLCSCCSSPLKFRSSCPYVVLQRRDGAIGESCGGFSKDRCTDEVNYSELKTSDSESEPRQRGDYAAAADNLDDFTLGHEQTNIGSSNAQEKVVTELTPIQNGGGGSGKKPCADSRELQNIHDSVSADIQSGDLPRRDEQPATEDSDMKDKPEDDVWHNAPSSTEFPGADDFNPAETNGKRPEFYTPDGSLRVHRDLKRLLSQLSSTSQPPDSPTGFVAVVGGGGSSSGGAGEQDEAAILRNISRALSLERSHSGVSESTANLDAGGECDSGSGTVHQLKQQVELDRRSMSLLWKELEEERSASAVAANQTMAMITRLQEEKAAMQMEASQYRRIMEEQSEYDREDLRRMAVAVQCLEAEVESYRTKLRDQSIADEIRDQMRLSPPGSRSTAASDVNAYISEQPRDMTGGGEEEEDAAAVAVAVAAALGDSEVGRRVRNGDSFTRWQQLQSVVTHGGADHHGRGREIGDVAASLDDEASELVLGARLQALEADRSSFPENSVSSARAGTGREARRRSMASPAASGS